MFDSYWEYSETTYNLSTFFDNVANQDMAVEVMQFTSLTDKNGKDIYAGDIVKGDWIDADSDIKDAVFEVSIKNGCIIPFTEATGTCSGWLYHTDLDNKDFEVIGNIHQHPELMESNND